MKKHSKSYRKLFNATLATTVAAGAFVAVVPTVAGAEAGTYKDVKPGLHYYEPIKNLSERGILIGYPDGTFKPNQAVTRGQAAKILALALELDTVNVKDPGFTDVKKSNQYYGPIAALVNAGIVNGYDDKTFRPGNELTRSQMAKIINIGFELDEETLTDTRFKDIKKGDAYAGYVQALISNGITTGTTPTTFSPNGKVTRGQMASFIVRTEAAKAGKEEAVSVKGDIVKITDDDVELTTGTYKLHASLKGLINTDNLAALQGATVDVKVLKGAITGLTSIELNASGTAANPVVLDVKGASFAGDVKVNGDHVTLQGWTLTGDVTVQSGTSVTFNTTGKIKKLTIVSKDAKITLGANTKIGDLILPKGVAAKDVIQDYDKVKKNIEKINGKSNPDNTPPSSGGGGGGGPTPSEPAGNKVLKKSLKDFVEAGNSAADDAVQIVLKGNTFEVAISDEAEGNTVGAFKQEAEDIFNEVKKIAVVNSAVVEYGNLEFKFNQIDNTQDFGEVLSKALKIVGLDDTAKLDRLKGKSFTFTLDGSIKNETFKDTYTFKFE